MDTWVQTAEEKLKLQIYNIKQIKKIYKKRISYTVNSHQKMLCAVCLSSVSYLYL